MDSSGQLSEVIINGRKYVLTIRQQPKQSRSSGFSEKVDRRPIDPTPIIQLRVTRLNGMEDCSYIHSPYFFVFATLIYESKGSRHSRSLSGHRHGTAGSAVSSLYRLTDIDNTDGAFFVFPDLSVRTEGYYRLRFSLYECKGSCCQYYYSVLSDSFYVYSAKRFPGMNESTTLSKAFAKQGLKIRIRKESRIKSKRLNSSLSKNLRSHTLKEIRQEGFQQPHDILSPMSSNQSPTSRENHSIHRNTDDRLLYQRLHQFDANNNKQIPSHLNHSNPEISMEYHPSSFKSDVSELITGSDNRWTDRPSYQIHSVQSPFHPLPRALSATSYSENRVKIEDNISTTTPTHQYYEQSFHQSEHRLPSYQEVSFYDRTNVEPASFLARKTINQSVPIPTKVTPSPTDFPNNFSSYPNYVSEDSSEKSKGCRSPLHHSKIQYNGLTSPSPERQSYSTYDSNEKASDRIKIDRLLN